MLLGHLCILFGELSVHVLCPLSDWIIHIFTVEFWEFFLLITSPLLDMWFANIAPGLWFFFSFSSHGFPEYKVFNFDKIQFINFPFCGLYF